MYKLIVAAFLSALLGTPALAANDNAGKNGETVESVRKTCECVRRNSDGFPYIEPRITTCKTYKNADGHVKAFDCMNCYALCAEKPTS
ncbi:MAG: hypothetical protein PHS77_03805 [Gallionellaceae bacterium]|nr:hypothetical protein [Gallionellaceae bacterium]